MSTSSVRTLIQEARQNVKDHNYGPALLCYNQVKEQCPQDWEPNFYIPYIQAMQSLSDQAAITHVLDEATIISNLIPATIAAMGEIKEENELIGAFELFTGAMIDFIDVIDAMTVKFSEILENEVTEEDKPTFISLLFKANLAIASIMGIWGINTWEVFGENFIKTTTACYNQAINYYGETKKYALKEEDINMCDERIESLNQMLQDIHSLQNTPPEAQEETTQTDEQKGGCYIATAVYGSYDCPEVWTLRRFRDYYLDAHWGGKLFIRIYYATSPTLVRWFGDTRCFKLLLKRPLDKLVEYLHRQGIEDTQYQDKY